MASDIIDMEDDLQSKRDAAIFIPHLAGESEFESNLPTPLKLYMSVCLYALSVRSVCLLCLSVRMYFSPM